MDPVKDFMNIEKPPKRFRYNWKETWPELFSKVWKYVKFIIKEVDFTYVDLVDIQDHIKIHYGQMKMPIWKMLEYKESIWK